nr:protein ZINC INDUCED FACILITATOR-LIKE 1-like [Quercus suber]
MRSQIRDFNIAKTEEDIGYYAGYVSIITGLFLLQNRAVDQDQRGAAKGIAMTLMSLFKAAGPAGGGAIFSWAQKRQDAAFLPGDNMVFFVLNVIEAIGVLMTFKPFLFER